MVCGNCGEPGPLELDVPVHLCVVASEEAACALIEDVDPLVLASAEASPADLFEDDLILALPDRPCRGRLDCPKRPVHEAPEEPAAPEDVEPSPFAVLARLKGDEDR
jgi:uncharacterized protein